MRGWSRDEQRAVFQLTGVASFLMIIVAFGGIGIISIESVRLFPLGLPAPNWDLGRLGASRQA